MSKERIRKLLAKYEPIVNETFEFAGSVNCSDLSFPRLRFKNCIFNDRFRLDGANNVNYVEFNNCQFKYGLSIDNWSNIGRFIIDGCTFSRFLGFSDSTIHELIIKSSKSRRIANIDQCKMDSITIEIVDDSMPNSIYLSSAELEEVEILTKESGKISELRIESLKKGYINANVNHFELNSSEFDHLELASINSIKRIEHLEIGDCNVQGELLCQDLELGQLKISNVKSNLGMINFSYLSIGKATFDNCQINGLILNQVTFLDAPEIIGSNAETWKMMNLTWSDKYKSLYNSFLHKKIPLLYQFRSFFNKDILKAYDFDLSLLKDQIETYRQLKISSRNSGNLPEMLGFYRNEMKLYWKLVRIDGGITWYDRTLIFINRWSSDFGQNWVLSLFWLFTFHFFLFSCIVNWYYNNHLSGETEFGQFWVLLNPVHKTPDYVNTGMGLFTEFVLRVVNSFFIYQLVRSSRKFGKLHN